MQAETVSQSASELVASHFAGPVWTSAGRVKVALFPEAKFQNRRHCMPKIGSFAVYFMSASSRKPKVKALDKLT